VTGPATRDVVSGWPTNADFRAFLGLDTGDTTDLEATDAALNAAIIDAVAVGKDPADPILDERDRQALFTLGALYLSARNRPETWQPGSPTFAQRHQMRRVLSAGTIRAV
jgi:hypothetical protein